MAHYGKRSNDVSMQTEACRWYGKGLEKQMIESRQMQLQLANGDDVEDRIGVAAICGLSFWVGSNLSYDHIIRSLDLTSQGRSQDARDAGAGEMSERGDPPPLP